MPAPELADVLEYLDSSESSWPSSDVASAFAAEKASQAGRCRVPADDEAWPADLVEALFRRVAHNLAVRALPLGVQTTVTDAAALNTYVGGLDAEARRLEAPYRRLVVG